MADEEKPKCSTPFCLPEGTVRAVLAVILTVGLLYLAVDTRTNEAIGAVIAITTWCLKEYFQIRGEEKK